MRIALCITTLDMGGAERAMTELALGLAGDGQEVRVDVLGQRPLPPQAACVDRLAEADIPVSFCEASRGWHAAGALRQLTREWIAFQPDVVQSFLHHANVLGSWAASRAGVPHVVTGIRVAERRRNLHRWLARVSDRLASRHVCVSRDVSRFAAEVIGLAPQKLVVIPNGVETTDLPAGLPPDLALPDDRAWLVFAGRLAPQKRLFWLLERMPDVFRQLPGHDLVLVGRGPDESRLRRKAAALSIASRVHFVGWRNDVRRILAAADVVLLTSAWEGFPNVVLEAMAAGRPLVCTQAEGIAEALGPGASSQLVGRDEAGPFAERVVRLATDRQLNAEVGGENRSRAAAEFRFAEMVRRYQAVYAELSPTARRGGPVAQR